MDERYGGSTHKGAQVSRYNLLSCVFLLGEKMLHQTHTIASIKDMRATKHHLCLDDQFNGFNGSSGPSKSIKFAVDLVSPSSRDDASHWSVILSVGAIFGTCNAVDVSALNPNPTFSSWIDMTASEEPMADR